MAKPKPRPIITDIIAGGIAGSVGGVITSPLDVIQTRLQSSAFQKQRLSSMKNLIQVSLPATSNKPAYFWGIFSYGRHIARSEGFQSLFKGLTPTLLAVATSRAMYFSIYRGVKDFLNSEQSLIFPNSTSVYMIAGATSQFVTLTITNPLWFLKTRLQLDFTYFKHKQKMSIFQTISQAYRENGLRTFYRGLKASYLGVFEAALNFACYEKLKSELLRLQGKPEGSFGIVESIVAQGAAKVISILLCYPYEVIRTRQRQQQSFTLGEQRYQTCMQTLKIIVKEEKYQGLYAGMATSLIRQVPYFIIMFCTYEGVVFLIEQRDNSN